MKTPTLSTMTLLLSTWVFASGCTFNQLRQSTVRQASTMTELQYQQVLNNLAFLSQDPYALPYHVSIKTGSTQISDTGTAGINFDLATFSGSSPSLTGSRAIVDQWGTVPITDDSALRLLRIAYQRALGLDKSLSVEDVNDLAHTLSAQIGTNSDISIYGEIFRFVLEDAIVTQRNAVMPDPLPKDPPTNPEERQLPFELQQQKKVQYTADSFDLFSESVNKHFITALDENLYRINQDPNSRSRFKLDGSMQSKPADDPLQPRKPTGLVREADRQVQDILGTLDKIPRGWFRVGSRRDIPHNACYKGRCGDTWVWVCPEGRADLAEFSLAVLKLASAFKDPQLVTAPSGIQFSPALAGQR